MWAYAQETFYTLYRSAFRRVCWILRIHHKESDQYLKIKFIYENKSRYLNYNVMGNNSSNHKIINNDLFFYIGRALLY